MATNSFDVPAKNTASFPIEVAFKAFTIVFYHQ